MFKKVDTNMNFPEMEEKVLDFWKENDVFQKSIDIREGAPKFVFFEGPPTANGMRQADRT